MNYGYLTKNNTYTISGCASGKVFDVKDAKDVSTTDVILFKNHDSANQRWYIYDLGDGTYCFRPAISTTRVLDVRNNDQNDGANLQIYTWNASNAQKFKISKCEEVANLNNDFYAFIMNSHCWKPIMQLNDAKNNNVVLGTENSENMPRILWHFYKANDEGFYTITSVYNEKRLNVGGNTNDEKVNIDCSEAKVVDGQKWYVLKSSDGTYRLRPYSSDKVLDIVNSGTTDGTNVQILKSNNTEAQKFKIYKIYDTRDKINYSITSEKNTVGINEKVKIQISNAPYATSVKIHIVDPGGKETVVDNGSLINYSFSGNQIGKYIIYAEVKSPVSYEIGSKTSKFITISVTRRPGDITNDGSINLKDQSLLQQYINGWSVDINTFAADVNGDGAVNLKDQSLLQQYINGWDVELK